MYEGHSAPNDHLYIVSPLVVGLLNIGLKLKLHPPTKMFDFIGDSQFLHFLVNLDQSLCGGETPPPLDSP